MITGIDSSGNAIFNNRENTFMTFGTNNTERMRILSGGNVGIGTTTPSSLINMVSSTNTYLTIETTNTSNYSGILFDTPGTSIMLAGGGTTAPVGTAGLYILDVIQGFTRMVMDVNGNFVFGENEFTVTSGVNYDFFGTL